jgi:hypothetical protein
VAVEWASQLELRVFQDWARLGTQRTASGTRCVGFVPQVGPAAWLHRFYVGCPASEMDAFEERTGVAIPAPWRQVLLGLNGLTLFVAKVSLDGVLPQGLVRRSIADPSQFSLQSSNTIERPRGRAIRPSDFVIGGNSVDPSLYVLRDGEGVLKVTRDGSAELAFWPSAREMLVAEYEALSGRHDPDGTYRPS